MALQKGEGRYNIIHKNWSVTGRADQFDAWLAQPDALGRFASLCVACDVTGLTPQLQEFAKLLARMGYNAVVPDLYYRVGGVPRGATPSQIQSIAASVSDGRMMADLQDAAAFLEALALNVDESRMGLVGIGMGARIAVLLGARMPDAFKCVVAIDPIVGKVEAPNGSVRPAVLPDDAEAIEVPVLALFAGRDGTSSEDVARFRDVLGPKGRIVTYPKAAPGFLDESSDAYDVPAAEDVYDRIVRFLDEVLGHDPT